MIKLADAINYLSSNGNMIIKNGLLYNIVEVKTKKVKYSHLEAQEVIKLVETMMIGI